MEHAEGGGQGGTEPAWRQERLAEGVTRAKILIVDDDPDVVAGTRVALERRGYRVITAANAVEGEQRLEAESPDLILLDIMMPTGTEGFHFVWNVRRHPHPACHDVPIIVVSAIHRTTDLRLYPDEADREYAPGEFLPVQAFLDKPVDTTELAHVIEAVLTSRKHP